MAFKTRCIAAFSCTAVSIISTVQAKCSHTDSYSLQSITSVDNVVFNGDQRQSFAVVYDAKTKCPKYVVEKLVKEVDENKIDTKKRPTFYAEPAITIDAFKMHPKDYTDSVYDRGHMVPSADFHHNKELNKATFSMANVCPQAPGLNKGFWSRFEAWLRHQLAIDQFEELVVFTGPVYAPLFIANEWVHINRTIGYFPKLVHVPTHFYKVVVGRRRVGSAARAGDSKALAVSSSGSDKGGSYLAIGAFLVPNVNTVDTKTPLGNFVVRLDQLEPLLGHCPWRAFTDSSGDAKQSAVPLLDAAVPDCRDLAITLSAKNLRGTDSKEVPSHGQATHPDVLYINAKYAPIPVKTERQIETALLQQRSSKGGAGGPVGVVHLCECVDCNRALFAK